MADGGRQTRHLLLENRSPAVHSGGDLWLQSASVAAKPRALESGEVTDTLQKPWLSFPPWELDWASRRQALCWHPLQGASWCLRHSVPATDTHKWAGTLRAHCWLQGKGGSRHQFSLGTYSVALNFPVITPSLSPPQRQAPGPFTSNAGGIDDGTVLRSKPGLLVCYSPSADRHRTSCSQPGSSPRISKESKPGLVLLGWTLGSECKVLAQRL